MVGDTGSELIRGSSGGASGAGLRGGSGGASGGGSDARSGAASRDAILDLCDRLLDEVGRRQHLFSWLRAPGAGTEEWLAVDAYYPARRLVVLCNDADGENAGLFDELIPAHGLGLLRVELDALGPDPEEAVSAQIAALELAPREIYDLSVGAPTVRVSPMARVGESLMQATAPPVRPRVRLTPRGSAAGGARAAGAAGAAGATGAAGAVGARGAGIRGSRDASLALGVGVGIVLAIVVTVELYLGVGEIALGGDHWLLAFGFALDIVARVLGLVAGERAGRLDWALWSVVGGSPVVAGFTLFRQEGRMTTEPGPIAGLISVLAMTAVVLWIVGSLLGV